MYTYVFLPSSMHPLTLPEGIVGRLELIEMNGLAALVETDLTVEELQITDNRLMQAILDHDRVIRDVFEQTTILPLRFGTQFVSRQSLLDHLASRATEYLERLACLEGQAEYLLKLTPVASSDLVLPTELKGRDYFLAKKQLYQAQLEQQQQQQAELQQTLEAIAQSYPNWVQSQSEASIERIYVLGDRQEESRLHKFLNIWQQHCPHWQLSVGESLPPYHFV